MLPPPHTGNPNYLAFCMVYSFQAVYGRGLLKGTESMQIVVLVIKMRPQFRCRGKMLSGSKVPTQAVTVRSRHGSDVRKLMHGFLLYIL